MKAPLPPNEAQRLETLRGYDVLDTPPEPGFDDLTLLAAQICQVPIAVISLIDENRQWFKSITGLNATETPRDVAFCAHAILHSDEVLEVRDAQLDPRFADNPLVTADPHIRFYAGAPLVAPDGVALGTLCVIDRVPRTLNAEQQTALRALSRTVIAQLELRRILAAHRRAEEQLQSLNASLDQKVEARNAELRREMEVRRESEARTRLILDNSINAVISADQVGRVIGWNREAEHIFGYSSDDALGKHLAELIVPPAHREAHRQGLQRYVKTGNSTIIGKRVEITGMRADGSEVPIELSIVANQQKGKYFFSAFIQDITERKRAEAALGASEQRLRLIIETEPECVKVVDPLGHLLEMNAAGLAMVEAESLGEAQQYTLIDYILPEYHDAFRALHKRVMLGESGTLEFEVLGLRGTRRWLETHAAPMRDATDKVVSLLGITRDITARKQAEERHLQLTHFDVLTGLPNRALFTDRINYGLSMAQRSQGQLAVLCLDLDHFKNVNDNLGHRIGDALLIEIAKRLKSVMREEDTVSRQGGDEFILVLAVTDADGAAHVAEKLLATVAQLCQIEHHELVITVSIGIAMYPDDGEDFDTLSQCADVAMYRAKRDGRNNFCFFTAEMQVHSARSLQLENALRHALAHDQLYLHYQPQMSMQDGRIIGAEALLRWQHPELGVVSPAEFIPIAENSGQILQIGEWVLRTAAHQMKSWMDSGLAPMIIAVNFSAVQFRHAHLPELVTQILDEVHLPPQYLELELTEGVAMDDPLGAIAIMDNLHQRGIRMSIDDFGTGYSSLSYLKRFKVYKLKIDQSFVRDITDDPEDKAIVSAIISLANSLGLQTIAEGVETEGQLAFLREQGCDEMQGYYFSKPLPAEQFEAFVRAQSQV